MKANSLSICIPSLKGEEFFCNKDCPYCISKMTGMNPVNTEFYTRNIIKAQYVAEAAQVTSVVLTGKTEPLTNMDMVLMMARRFHKFPLEVQTNGLLLTASKIKMLAYAGINTVAISIDSWDQLDTLRGAIGLLREKPITVRLTINLTRDILRLSPEEVHYYELAATMVNKCREYGADQVSFRELTIPDHPIESEASKAAQAWISADLPAGWAKVFLASYDMLLQNKGLEVRSLPFGPKIYMLNGVSCTSFTHCIQEKPANDDIRSLIYYEDGHMSTMWYGSNYGRIF